nr:hypothetical protein [Defluviicoccus vanus]
MAGIVARAASSSALRQDQDHFDAECGGHMANGKIRQRRQIIDGRQASGKDVEVFHGLCPTAGKPRIGARASCQAADENRYADEYQDGDDVVRVINGEVVQGGRKKKLSDRTLSTQARRAGGNPHRAAQKTTLARKISVTLPTASSIAMRCASRSAQPVIAVAARYGNSRRATVDCLAGRFLGTWLTFVIVPSMPATWG